MLESSVTFFPQLRGAFAGARSPRLDQAYSGTKEMFAPHSSTNTKRLASIPEQPSPSRQPSRTRRAPPLPAIFFSAEAHALQRSRDSGVAHLNASHACK